MPAPSQPESLAASVRARAPTLYGIAVFKLGKGLLFTLLALGVYTLSDNNLPEEFRSLLQWFHLDPERKFFVRLASQLANISESRMVYVALGTFIYSLVAWIEGFGLLLRMQWACWLTIAEGAFFIPIEIYELNHTFSRGLTIILILNIIIVWYLFRNRHRIFRHHLRETPQASPGPA